MSSVLKKVQVIRSLDGEPEYVLLPYDLYQALHIEIDRKLAARGGTRNDDYVPFQLEDYIENPVALARIRARVTQAELARRLGVSQAYVSKVERQDRVTAKLLARVTEALGGS